LTAIPLPPSDVDGAALWLNAYGQVATLTWPSGGDPLHNHVSLWTPQHPHGAEGTLVTIGHEGDDIRALNAYGQVLGKTSLGNGYVWTPAQRNGVTGTVTAPGNIFVSFNGMTDLGLVYGEVSSWQPFMVKTQAAAWMPSEPNATPGKLLSLGTLGKATDSFISDVNQHGQVLGYSCSLDRSHGESPCKPGSRLFLWDQEHGMHELLGLVDGWPGYELDEREGVINDAGQIVVAARDKATQQGHLLLLTPETL
jgi:hypothetical protein